MNTRIEDYIQQGKSNNYLLAQAEGKLTAGEAAKILSKKFGIKVLAKNIEHLATEWHHAGVFKKYDGKVGGKKIYFFSLEELDRITVEQLGVETVKGFYVGFEKYYDSTRYGRKRWKPVLRFWEGLESKTPKNFTLLNEEQFNKFKALDGRELEPFQSFDVSDLEKWAEKEINAK